jgi:hypothetical protein
VRWASITLVALLLAGCETSQQALQERTITTGSTRTQVAKSETPHENAGLLAALRLWGEEVASAVRSAFTEPAPRELELCRETLVAAAEPSRAARVEAARAGPVRRATRGITTIPMDVQVTYVSGHVSEVKRARITCWLNDRDNVVELRGGGDRVITPAAGAAHQARLKGVSTTTTGSIRVMPPLLP